MVDLIRFRRTVNQARPFEIDALAALKQFYGADGFYTPEDYGKATISAQWLNTDEEGSVESLAVIFRLKSTKPIDEDPGSQQLEQDAQPFWAEVMIRDQEGQWYWIQDIFADFPLYKSRGEMMHGWYTIRTNISDGAELNYEIRYVNNGCFYLILEECLEGRARSSSKIKRMHGNKKNRSRRATSEL